ncbi:MAG: DUF2490 domain-containing protein [Planctomycetota bacterium]|jgi:hypothetical protein
MMQARVNDKYAFGSRATQLIVIIFLVVLSGVAEGGVFQFRMGTGLTVDIKKDLKFKFEEEIRFQDNQNGMPYHSSDFGLIYSGLNEHIDLGLFFKMAFAQIDELDDETIQENRPFFYVTYKDYIGNIQWSNRSRIEYRMIDKQLEFWRYRNKFGLKFPELWEDSNVRPYVADEVFFAMDGRGYTKNRLYAGFTSQLLENVKGDIYYLWERRDLSVLDDLHVLGLKFTFAF